jgi:putative peptidoglycan lipid II flippase
MLKDVARVAFANIIVLFLGFLRDVVLSYNFGISKFTDSFFSIYLLVEDFNVIISTGLVFGLINYFGTLDNLGINIKNFICSKIKYILFVPLILILINVLLFYSNFASNDLFLISFFGTSGVPLSLISGFLTAYLMYKSNIFIAILSKGINYSFIIICLFYLDENSNYLLFGLMIFTSYLIQLGFLFFYFSKSEEQLNTTKKVDKNNFLSDSISWAIAPFFMPFLGNIFIRIILLNNGDQLVSILNYANKILVLVNAFTFSIILVGFQKAISIKNKDITSFKHDIDLNIRRIIDILIPLSLLISLNSDLIIKLIFERGQFLPETTELAAYSLSVLSLSIFPGTLFGYLIRIYAAFYDRNFYYFTFLFWMISTIVFTMLFVDEYPILSYPLAYLISLTTVCSLTLYRFHLKLNITNNLKDILNGILLGIIFLSIGIFLSKLFASIMLLLFLIIIIFKKSNKLLT